ncbi:MAG TPA: hypothetical protein VFK44_02065 [Bacillales bacterium]|nr:hypothetical protein [Bacillales bacterium]
MPQTTGVHETLEVRELLSFKNLCLTKSTAMSALAQDEDLRKILQQAAQTDRENIQSLQNLLAQEVTL